MTGKRSATSCRAPRQLRCNLRHTSRIDIETTSPRAGKCWLALRVAIGQAATSRQEPSTACRLILKDSEGSWNHEAPGIVRPLDGNQGKAAKRGIRPCPVLQNPIRAFKSPRRLLSKGHRLKPYWGLPNLRRPLYVFLVSIQGACERDTGKGLGTRSLSQRETLRRDRAGSKPVCRALVSGSCGPLPVTVCVPGSIPETSVSVPRGEGT